ncbi:DUF2231 domain-containing protein [soil metagenome]
MFFFILAYIASFQGWQSKFVLEFNTVAYWCLWFVSIITIATIVAGFYAYNTVHHDVASHIAMTKHRNWALPTAAAIWLLSGWSIWRYKKKMQVTLTFLLALLLVQALLLTTAWRGGELVFRYGLGVMSLPQAEGMGHHHPHTEPQGSTTESKSAPIQAQPHVHSHEHDAHDHED